MNGFRFWFLFLWCLYVVRIVVVVVVVVFPARIVVLDINSVVRTGSGIFAANNFVVGGTILPESIHRNFITDQRLKFTMRSIILEL